VRQGPPEQSELRDAATRRERLRHLLRLRSIPEVGFQRELRALTPAVAISRLHLSKTAVDEQLRAGNEAAVVGSEKRHRLGYFGRFAQTAAPPQPTGGGIDFGPRGLGRIQHALPIKAEHIAILNSKWAVVIWPHPRTAYRLDLSTLALPYFFERRDGMSEMNWPDGPDPSHYREHRNELSNK
jgi:hypothetical protein